jgi:hypothetical protein
MTRLLQDLPNRVAAVEGFCGILEHDLHLLTQGSHLLGREVGDVTPLEGDGAGARLEQLEQRTPQGGLAASRLPHQAKGLPLPEIKADAIHRVDGVLLAQETATHLEMLL